MHIRCLFQERLADIISTVRGCRSHHWRTLSVPGNISNGAPGARDYFIFSSQYSASCAAEYRSLSLSDLLHPTSNFSLAATVGAAGVLEDELVPTNERRPGPILLLLRSKERNCAGVIFIHPLLRFSVTVDEMKEPFATDTG